MKPRLPAAVVVTQRRADTVYKYITNEVTTNVFSLHRQLACNARNKKLLFRRVELAR